MKKQSIMKITLSLFVVALSLGSGAMQLANAQASDDCVNWQEAIKSVDSFSGLYTLMALVGVPDSLVYTMPGDGVYTTLYYPTDTNGFTLLAPTNEAIFDMLTNTQPYESGVSSDLLTTISSVVSYHLLIDDAYGSDFGLGGNRYQLMKTALNELPLKIQKAGGGVYEANSPNGIGTITEPDLPDNICVPVSAENGEVVNVPVTIYAIDQIMLPFAISPSCGDSFDDCAEAAYNNGIANINTPQYVYGKKVKWAK